MQNRLVRTLLLPACAFAGGLVAQLASGSAASAAPGAESPYFAISQLGRVVAQIENDYVDPVDRKRLVEGAIKGMVAELDPHSSYMNAADYALFNGDTGGQFGGVGLEVDLRGDAITVVAPIESSPAARAGIVSGDKIVAIDGKPALATSLDKLVRTMRGTPGTHVLLAVRREGQREPLSFDLVREIVHVTSVVGKRLAGDIAYICIKQFQDKTHDELLRAIAAIRAEAKAPIAGVVLDMRGNPGGLVDQAAAVADEFLSAGAIYSTRHRGILIDEVGSRSGGALSDVPVVVLVNQWSASASELVGGALQDNRRALVVGERTFGKGSVQSIIDLPGGEGMRLTTARYYTPSGHAIQADGLPPDITVESGAPANRALPQLREGDLDGALAGEGAARNASGSAVRYSGDAGAGDLPDAKNVPRDPAAGGDVVLRVGYVTLRDKLVGHGPLVR